jgi:hypothetical protein
VRVWSGRGRAGSRLGARRSEARRALRIKIETPPADRPTLGGKASERDARSSSVVKR